MYIEPRTFHQVFDCEEAESSSNSNELGQVLTSGDGQAYLIVNFPKTPQQERFFDLIRRAAAAKELVYFEGQTGNNNKEIQWQLEFITLEAIEAAIKFELETRNNG